MCGYLHCNKFFVIIEDKSVRATLLKAIPGSIPMSENEVNEWLDSWDSSDKKKQDMYLEAMSKQYAMLFNAGCLIILLFRQEGALLQPHTLSSLNGFASIWCCIENILLAATAEGILGVTRIPKGNEAEHVQSVISYPDDYVMPCYIGLGYPTEDAIKIRQKVINANKKYT